MEPADDLLLFAPVPQSRATANGWTAERQRAFVHALRYTGVIAHAARSVGMSVRSAWALRDRAGPESGFVRAWDLAVEEARARAIDAVKARGFGPLRVPVFYRGRQVGWRERYDDRLLFAALRAMDGEESRRHALPHARKNRA